MARQGGGTAALLKALYPHSLCPVFSPENLLSGKDPL